MRLPNFLTTSQNVRIAADQANKQYLRISKYLRPPVFKNAPSEYSGVLTMRRRILQGHAVCRHEIRNYDM